MSWFFASKPVRFNPPPQPQPTATLTSCYLTRRASAHLDAILTQRPKPALAPHPVDKLEWNGPKCAPAAVRPWAGAALLPSRAWLGPVEMVLFGVTLVGTYAGGVMGGISVGALGGAGTLLSLFFGCVVAGPLCAVVAGLVFKTIVTPFLQTPSYVAQLYVDKKGIKAYYEARRERLREAAVEGACMGALAGVVVGVTAATATGIIGGPLLGAGAFVAAVAACVGIGSLVDMWCATTLPFT